MTIDLETGKATGGEKSEKSPPKRSGTTVKERLEKGLETRITEAFGRIADLLEDRGDTELSDAITRGKKALSNGLMSLTRSIEFLRSPLLVFLNLIEILLAFGEIGGILFRRWVTRRERLMAERAQAQAEWEAAQAGQSPPYPPHTGVPVP